MSRSSIAPPPSLRRLCAGGLVLAVAASVLAASAPAQAYTAPATGYVAAPAQVVLDTQTGFNVAKHPLTAHQTVVVSVKVPPSGVTGFHLTLTAINPASAGYLIAWPNGTPRPVASMLNFSPGRTASAATFVKGHSSLIDIYNGSSGSADVNVVLTGYTTFSGWGRGAAVPVTPARLLDTRIGNGAPRAPIPPGGNIVVRVTGRGGVPVSLSGCPCVSAVALTLTAVTPAGNGYVSTWAHGAAPATTSAINLTAGLTESNLVWAGVGADGYIVLHNATSGPLNLIADVEGYDVYAGAANAGGQLFAGTGIRILDTRHGLGISGPVAPHATVTLGGLDSQWAYLLDVIETGASQPGDLTVWTAATPRPIHPALFFRAGQTVADVALVIPSGSGRIAFYNNSSAPIHIIADQEGRSTGCC